MTKKKLPFKIFTLDAGTYDYSAYVVISKDTQRVAKFVVQYHGGYLPEESNFHAKGLIFRKKGYAPIIWLPRFPKTPVEHGTVAHEIFHLVYSISKWADFYLNNGSEENYCHLIGYLTKQFYEKGKSNRASKR